MKTMPSRCFDICGPILRRDLVTILKYVNRGGRSQKCVDGSFNTEVHLDRLATAARMQ